MCLTRSATFIQGTRHFASDTPHRRDTFMNPIIASALARSRPRGPIKSIDPQTRARARARSRCALLINGAEGRRAANRGCVRIGNKRPAKYPADIHTPAQYNCAPASKYLGALLRSDRAEAAPRNDVYNRYKAAHGERIKRHERKSLSEHATMSRRRALLVTYMSEN